MEHRNNPVESDLDMLTLARLRCSVRSFSERPVEREKLEYILETARLAPSAVNFQPWYFIVVRADEHRKMLQDCYERDWFRTAPVYIIVCADHRESWLRKSDGKDHGDIDAAIAAEHICLAATEQDLGTCWVCNFDVEKCHNLFGLPEGVEPVVIIPVGYPEDPDIFIATPKKRKAFNEVVKWEKY
ncbi:nitroreductase family protein [Coprobacter tertius]|uniref:Nitroreductase family protein n=1 Tax=Coprobacter tertius TaxID=2944915 RepID=A0ABT1MFQ3_9BACT|nr:nitroreductase family protein [Coprobacter tertius]MCP9611464.1 nitroreductase family protein [Coprobacter tertius]